MGVQRVIKLARALERAGEGLELGPKEKILSSNTFAGVSINLPIYETCQPTKVCAESCYAARNTPIGMKVAVSKQLRLYRSMCADPLGVGERLVRELRSKMRRGLKFLRWNGVGDLFPEAIECLTYVADQLPELALWVVTRKPAMARQVPDRRNIFVQFSLDRDSAKRYLDMLNTRDALSSRIFFSYQAAPGEVAPPAWVKVVPLSVYYSHLYKAAAPDSIPAGVSCPQNESASLKDVCVDCGRCWNGEAVELRARGV